MGQYDKVFFDGKQVTRRMRQANVAAAHVIRDRFDVPLLCYQGSWRPETSYSGTTHTKRGVEDLYVPGMSTASHHELDQITRILRREGHLAAQLRGPFCDMPWHWHCCDLDTEGMDSNAVWQVGQYRAPGGPYNGLNAGVKSHNLWTPDPIRKWQFKS